MTLKETSLKVGITGDEGHPTRHLINSDDDNTAFTRLPRSEVLGLVAGEPFSYGLLFLVVQTPIREPVKDALTQGGFDSGPIDPETVDPLTRTAIKYQDLLDNSLNVEEAARRLGTDIEGITRRLAERTLYGILTKDVWKIPSFQFEDGEPLPGLESVMPLLHDDLHPIAVQNWFTSLNTDLMIRGEMVSPRQWLLGGRDPDKVARIAIDVQVPKLPPPPRVRELREKPPDRFPLSAGTELWRLYFRGGEHPTEWNEFRRFGPLSTARFDHHPGAPRVHDRRAIIYVATHMQTCIAEAFQETKLIDRNRRSPWLVGFALRSDVEVLNLRRLWPTQAGASTEISSSGFRRRTQHWSRSIYAAYRGIAGLLYGSSMHGYDPAIALYERAQFALDESPFFHESLASPVLLPLLKMAARELDYDLL